MVTSLDIVVEISDLFEATGSEGSLAAQLFDSEILPHLTNPLHEAVGLGDRFSQVIARVKAAAARMGSDSIRTIKDMMKSALLTYVEKTNDTQTAREIFHRAIMSGADTMLTVTGATILANALAGQHKQQATALVRGVAGRMSGKQPVGENASGGAVSAGAIAVATTPANKKKQIIRRQNSIFAETVTWEDLQGIPQTIGLLENVAYGNKSVQIEGIIVDPTTAELILAVHQSLDTEKKPQYEAKSLKEMIDIAYRAVERGLISVTMSES
jgi:hypothetical protein